MARPDLTREKIETALGAVFVERHFRNRSGEVWTRERSGVQWWASLDIHPYSRSDDLSADAFVGVRFDTVERLLSQIRGTPLRRQTPTFIQQLSGLDGGTPGVRAAGARWLFRPQEPIVRLVADFASAFVASALPFLERASTLDGLAGEMVEGRLDGENRWRLPLVHLLRGDAESARAALEQATRWAQHSGDVDAYRAFAMDVVRRLGDAAVVETPCEELVSVLRPALRAAFPDRAAPILAALVRSFWWEEHPRSGDVAHCAFCGTTDAEAPLFPETIAIPQEGSRAPGVALRICDTCVATCHVMLEHPLATGATRWLRTELPTGSRRLDPAPPPRGVTAGGFAADAVRALKALDDAARFVAPVERRLLSAPADRPPESVCVACGPIRAPRSLRHEYQCSFCRRYLYEEASVEAGRAGICEDCVNAFLPEVDAERRLA